MKAGVQEYISRVRESFSCGLMPNSKPSVAKTAPASKRKQKTQVASDGTELSPHFRWQMGGLIAGIVVALLAAAEPGKQVCHHRL